MIEGCDFENTNPFSMNAYDASMQVTGNTFRRSSMWDAQMSHFIVTEGMDNSTRYAESWSLDLKKTVYALFTENTWVGTPRIRVQYTGASAWDNTNFTPAIFKNGNLKNAQNAFVHRDRFQPSAVEFLASYEGKSNVLHYTLDERTAQANRDATYKGHFYNTQGRHFEVFNPAHLTKWEVSGEIYVDAQMIADQKPFRSELWTASRNATTNGEEYPMLGIANVVEDAGGIYQSTMDHAVVRIWGENDWTNVEGVAVEAGWHTVKMVSNGTNVTYYFDSQEVGQYASVSTPIYMFSVMPQAFHYDYKHTADNRWFYEGYTCETYFCNINYKLTE